MKSHQNPAKRNTKSDLFIFYTDRIFKSASNIAIAIYSSQILDTDSYFNFIACLSLYFIFYALSTIGLDSKVYSRIEENKLPRKTAADYISTRAKIAIAASLALYIYASTATKVTDNFVIIAFSALILVRVSDIYEHILIGTNKKLTFSKISLCLTLLFTGARLWLLYLNKFHLMIFSFLIEGCISGYIYRIASTSLNCISDLPAKPLIERKETLVLILNALLAMFVTRFDQLFLSFFIEKNSLAAYYTAIRFYEPALTFMQILSTFLISRKIAGTGIRENLTTFHAAALAAIAIHFTLLILISKLINIEALNYLSLLGTPALALLSTLYFLNGSRVHVGKILVYTGLSNTLLVRTAAGAATITILSLTLDFSKITTFISSMVISLLVMVAISAYSIGKKK